MEHRVSPLRRKCGSSVGDGAFPQPVIFRLTYPGIKWTCWEASIGPFFSLVLIQVILAFMSLWSASGLITAGFARFSWDPAPRDNWADSAPSFGSVSITFFWTC